MHAWYLICTIFPGGCLDKQRKGWEGRQSHVRSGQAGHALCNLNTLIVNFFLIIVVTNF